jgi:3-phosphoshikimate 1-carboxyvinyltransferase
MLGALADGKTVISGFLNSDDCFSTIRCFKAMGVRIETEDDNRKAIVHGVGPHGLKQPEKPLNVGNSGTTLRLLTGILAWQDFSCEIDGDLSIRGRPMKRVIEPLSLMGADIIGEKAPLVINGRKLRAIEYAAPIASAQLKSAVLLAGLGADGETTIIEKNPSRDHTEIALKYFGADISRENSKIRLVPPKSLHAADIEVSGDISSAAFIIVAALILPGSAVTIANVNVNPTRTGLLTALKRMGADISTTNVKTICGEPTADIIVRHSRLKGIEISGGIIPLMIDEIPAFTVAAAFADGVSAVRDAEELRVKESDRIDAMSAELSKMDADIEATRDGLVIRGGKKLSGAALESHGDHRVAMSLYIAALAARGESVISGSECVGISFPRFYDTFSP